MLNQLQGIHVSPVGCHLDVALYRKMCRTCRLTRSCPSLVAVDLRVVPVVRIPFIPAPLYIVRELNFRILDLPMLRTQLLPQLRRAYRTDFHAHAACHAF